MDLHAVAHHEAGHCVVAVLCGLPIRYVTIIPGKRKNMWGQVATGRTLLRKPRGILTPEKSEIEFLGALLVCYAGFLSEQTFTGKPADPSSVLGDHEDAQSMLSKWHHRAATDPNIKYLTHELAIVTANRLAMPGVCSDVESVANALLECKTLTGGQAKRLVRSPHWTDLSTHRARLLDVEAAAVYLGRTAHSVRYEGPGQGY